MFEDNPMIPILLNTNNIIEEFIDGESRSQEPNEQLKNEKINPKFKVWSKKKEKIIKIFKVCRRKHRNKLHQHTTVKKVKMEVVEL
jgi:hypothetical protein